MIKDHWKKEIALESHLQKGVKGKDVERVQEWLNIHRVNHPLWHQEVVVDGDFGPITEAAIKDFQYLFRIAPTGIVDEMTWLRLVTPMKQAFQHGMDISLGVRRHCVEVAMKHVEQHPIELGNNEGPWVRSYMNGKDGDPYYWCMGAYQTWVDQAFSYNKLKFTDQMPMTFSCDTLGNHGLKTGRLIKAADIVKMKEKDLKKKIQPGDAFLRVKVKDKDWTHTGMILSVEGDIAVCAEGNTNDEGSRNGYEACVRRRNLRKGDLDVFTLNV